MGLNSRYKLSMKKTVILFIYLISWAAFSQYTDVINSNRPGLSVSAYAVGKNVLQIEAGVGFEQSDHILLNSQANILGSDLSLRYGLLFEQLEINWEGTFQYKSEDFLNSGINQSTFNFSRNRIGLKFLVYDRYKSAERNKPDFYSWRKNNVFQLKNLIPSISVYVGATFNLFDNPLFRGDPLLSYRAMIATQSRVTPRFVLITNFAYDRITTDFPELNYIVSLSHAFRNPKWSSFIEHQGIQSDRYADALIRGGIAYLFNDLFQADFNLGASLKNTPSRVFVTAGCSYRFDFHSDPPAIEDQKAGENGEPIKKNQMLNKDKEERKKRKKNGGSGAEDIDLGPSKKQLKKLKKEEKRKKKGKKKKKKDDGVIEF